MIRETEFIVQQHYKVTCDASPIEKVEYPVPEPDWAKEDRNRMHRMFQAIVTDEKALQAILEYCVLWEHDDEGTYITNNYGQDPNDVGLPHILVPFAHIFTQEDNDWLSSLIKSWDTLDYPEGCTEWLQECFKVKPSGWSIQEHLCERKIGKSANKRPHQEA